MSIDLNDSRAFLDTRNGLGYSKTFQIQYDGLKNIGKDSQGFDKFVYFDKVPWITTKTTLQIIALESYWNDKIEQMKDDYVRLGDSFTGVYIESVNVGDKLIINGDEYYSGSITESDYRNGIGTFPNTYNLFEWSGGQVSPAGFWDDNGRSTLHKKAYFNSPVFGVTASKTYTAATPDDIVGEEKTIAGVLGIVSSVNKSNPRYINGTLVYDFSVQLNSQVGTNVQI